MRPAERVRILVDAFNAGDLERVLDGVAPDVEILIPIYRFDDEVGPPALKGKEELRSRLLSRFEAGGRISLTSVSDTDRGALATINSRHGAQLVVTYLFDDQGLARRLVVLNQ